MRGIKIEFKIQYIDLGYIHVYTTNIYNRNTTKFVCTPCKTITHTVKSHIVTRKGEDVLHTHANIIRGIPGALATPTVQ